jgi:hypothetical protein
MTPPIKVVARTNNLDKCSLHISGAEGVATVIEVPADGNVYQGLHRAGPGLELAITEILAAHGITAPAPPSEAPEVPPSAPSVPNPES